MADKTLQHDLFLPLILLRRLSYHPPQLMAHSGLPASPQICQACSILKAFVPAISPAWNVLPPDICLYFPNTKQCSTPIALKSYFQRPLYLIFQLTSSSSVWPLSISLRFNFFPTPNYHPAQGIYLFIACNPQQNIMFMRTEQE